MTRSTEPINLSNVASGHVETQFQDALEVVARELNRVHDGIYEPDAKEVAGEITIKIRLAINVESMLVVASGGVTAVAMPKRVRRGAIAFLAGDRFEVERARQSDLLTPLDDQDGEGAR
jgi:hypothetical protein